MLLDEPFSSLDAALRDSTRRAVGAALAAAGATAVLVTHDQAEALSLADQVAVMRDGRLVQLSPPEEVYRTPADAGVARFVGEAVLLPGEVHDGRAACALGSVPVRAAGGALVEGPAQVLLRPEQIVLGPAGGPGDSGDSAGPGGSGDSGGVEAKVRDVSYFGHDAAVRLELVGGPEVVARTVGHPLPQPGTTVRLTITGEALAYPIDP